jgi:hypothetical protein
MKKIVLAVVIGTATCVAHAQLDLKGKMKEGEYETSFKMEIPGMPAGMAGVNRTYKQCVTREDLEKGKGDMFSDPKTGKNESSCEIKNMKNSGNTVSYDMNCPKEGMLSSTTLTFAGNNVKGVTTMKMSGANAKDMPPGMGNMQMQFESKYLGATCSK